MTSPLAIVQSLYQAFSKGDIPGVLAHVGPDCAWESWADHSAQAAGHPLFVARRGADGAMAFFQQLGSLVQIHDFRVLDVMAGERSAAAEIAIEFTYLPTGARVRDEEVHLWNFDAQGRVIRFRHYIDTAKHLQAAGFL